MMKQEPEQFEPNQQTPHQAPQMLIPNVLAQLGLEGKRKNVDHSLASLKKVYKRKTGKHALPR